MKCTRQVFGPARERFAQDYQLTLIILVAVTAVVVVTPFAVYRFIQKAYMVALTDFLVVVLGLGSALYAWKTGNTRIPGIVIALVLTLASTIVAALVKLDGALWFYPAVMFIFYLIAPTGALVMAAAVLATITFLHINAPGAIFANPAQMVSFLASATTAAIFSFFFALHSNRQREQLVRWATRDALTGLYNRHSMEEELQIALATRDRYGVQYGLMILDLDNFKAINDEAGHAAGDQILRDLAQLITTHTRTGDRAFRYGGDEFVILLPNTDITGLKTLARNLVNAVSKNLRWGELDVTASLGGALLTAEDSSESWNKRADRCLYQAKELGRNRAVVEAYSRPPG